MLESHEMDRSFQTEGKFSYLETGNPEGEVLLLLHGLFGALSNFEAVINHFSKEYKIFVPVLPIFELPLREVSIENLVNHISDFVEWKKLDKVHVLGNSLGGHLTLLFVIKHPELIQSFCLTGSSGLFENAMGSSYPRRNSYDFIKQKTQDTFYDPKIATKELIDEVYNTVNDRERALRIVMTAKSAIRHNLKDDLANINIPAMLIWGKEDKITPSFVGEEFHKLLPDSELVIINECGHAAMMERPAAFNAALEQFYTNLKARV